jgi:hypothetical protein
MRGGVRNVLAGGLLLAGARIRDYLCYVEYKQPDGAAQKVLFEVSKDSSAQVIEKMKNILGSKVSIPDFPQAVRIKEGEHKEVRSKHAVTIVKENRPVPEIKPDKALVVVVTPGVEGYKPDRYGKGILQCRMLANDRVIAVNKQGTYSFSYLKPGEYLLVAHGERPVGLRLKLEPGQGYYLFQPFLQGMAGGRTGLEVHTRELAMYHIGGMYYSDWKQK